MKFRIYSAAVLIWYLVTGWIAGGEPPPPEDSYPGSFRSTGYHSTGWGSGSGRGWGGGK
jgi:hypothetical protein